MTKPKQTLADKFRLDGKRALVTGASRGLGRAMALALAEAGADIIITGRTLGPLEETTAQIKELGVHAQFIAADMGVPETCESVFLDVLERFGPLDVLINNIGGRTGAQPTTELTLEQWRKAIDLNLTSCFVGTKLVGAAMIKAQQGGSIINISSMSALIANRDIGGRSYETSKAALLHFTRTAAADWGPHNVRVNAICPGLFMTDANLEWQKTRPEVIEKLVSLTPMGRTGNPEELGPLAVFLASDASSYITGAAHVIDGGYTLW